MNTPMFERDIHSNIGKFQLSSQHVAINGEGRLKLLNIFGFAMLLERVNLIKFLSDPKWNLDKVFRVAFTSYGTIAYTWV